MSMVKRKIKNNIPIMMLQENIQPSAPANRFKAADTSCLTERCNSSCMSMHASSILCMLLIPCRSLPMSVLKSLIASHSCKKTQPNKFPRMNFSCSHNNTRYPSKFKNRGITANIIPHLMITTSPFFFTQHLWMRIQFFSLLHKGTKQ